MPSPDSSDEHDTNRALIRAFRMGPHAVNIAANLKLAIRHYNAVITNISPSSVNMYLTD